MAAWADGEEDEVLILCRFPDFDNSRFFHTAKSVEMFGLETASPRMIVDGLYNFTGNHAEPFGTKLFFHTTTEPEGKKGDDGDEGKCAQLLGQSVHVANFTLDPAPKLVTQFKAKKGVHGGASDLLLNMATDESAELGNAESAGSADVDAVPSAQSALTGCTEKGRDRSRTPPRSASSVTSDHSTRSLVRSRTLNTDSAARRRRHPLGVQLRRRAAASARMKSESGSSLGE